LYPVGAGKFAAALDRMPKRGHVTGLFSTELQRQGIRRA
jgi:hypothetical protein